MLIVMSRNDNAPLTLVPVPEGCGAKRFCLGPLPLHGFISALLKAIALICSVRKPFTLGCLMLWIMLGGTITMKYEH